MGARTSLPAIEFAQRTHPGRDPTKQVNEDACDEQATPYGHLAVVCDGMGGHEHGREASALALATIFDVFAKAPPGSDRREVLRSALVQANKEVRGIGERGSHARPGSTVVAVLVHAGGAEIAHVGDSRCYLVHEGRLTQLTRDHSMVQQMVDAGFITAEEAATHPDANKISRALGMKADVDVEVRPEPVAYVSGDAFILCSDGLSDMVSEEEILRVVTSGSALQAVGQLIDLANAHGGHDNITVQVLRARESAAQQPSTVAPTLVDTVPGSARGEPAGPTSARGGPTSRRGSRRTAPGQDSSVQGRGAEGARAQTRSAEGGRGQTRAPQGAAPVAKEARRDGSARGRSSRDAQPPVPAQSAEDAAASDRSSVSRTIALILGALGLVAAGAAIYIELEHPVGPVRTTPAFAASTVVTPTPPASTPPAPPSAPSASAPPIPVAPPSVSAPSTSATSEGVDAALPPHVPTPSGRPHHRPAPTSTLGSSRGAGGPPSDTAPLATPPPLPAPSRLPDDDSH